MGASWLHVGSLTVADLLKGWLGSQHNNFWRAHYTDTRNFSLSFKSLFFRSPYLTNSGVAYDWQTCHGLRQETKNEVRWSVTYFILGLSFFILYLRTTSILMSTIYNNILQKSGSIFIKSKFCYLYEYSYCVYKY